MEPHYCLNKQEVTSDKYYFRTKHKYDCFGDLKFHPNPIILDDEALFCLGLKYDFAIDNCLKNYEAASDELFLSDNPLNLYYGRKKIEKTDDEKEEEEDIEAAE